MRGAGRRFEIVLTQFKRTTISMPRNNERTKMSVITIVYKLKAAISFQCEKYIQTST